MKKGLSFFTLLFFIAGCVYLAGCGPSANDFIDSLIDDLEFDEDCEDCYDEPRNLFEAIFDEDINAVRKLIREGANVNGKNSGGRTPLHEAVRDGLTDIANVLIDNGADVNATTSGFGDTPLHYAVRFEHNDIVRILIDAGANVNAADNKGITPLHEAAKDGNAVLVNILIDEGASIDTRDEEGKTPLYYAIDEGYPAVAEILRNAGATEPLIGEDGQCKFDDLPEGTHPFGEDKHFRCSDADRTYFTDGRFRVVVSGQVFSTGIWAATETGDFCFQSDSDESCRTFCYPFEAFPGKATPVDIFQNGVLAEQGFYEDVGCVEFDEPFNYSSPSSSGDGFTGSDDFFRSTSSSYRVRPPTGTTWDVSDDWVLTGDGRLSSFYILDSSPTAKLVLEFNHFPVSTLGNSLVASVRNLTTGVEVSNITGFGPGGSFELTVSDSRLNSFFGGLRANDNVRLSITGGPDS